MMVVNSDLQYEQAPYPTSRREYPWLGFTTQYFTVFSRLVPTSWYIVAFLSTLSAGVGSGHETMICFSS